MKWITLISIVMLLASCAYTSREVIEYRQVLVTPVIVKPVYSYSCGFYQEPFYLTETAGCDY